MRDESIDLSFLKTFIIKFLFINLTGKASTILTFSVFFNKNANNIKVYLNSNKNVGYEIT